MNKLFQFAILMLTSVLLGCGGGGNVSSPSSDQCDFFISSVPKIINQSGTWCLSENLEGDEGLSQDAITIRANAVRIDGRGFRLIGPKKKDTIYRGIIFYDQSDIVIENLGVEGFNTGVLAARTDAPGSHGLFADPSSTRVRIDNVHLKGQTFNALYMGADQVEIINVSINDVGGSTARPHSFAYGIIISGNYCKITENSIRGLTPAGSGEGVGIAIYNGSDCLVRGNLIEFTSVPEYSSNFGMWINTPVEVQPVVQKNTIINAAYAGGPSGRYEQNTGTAIWCDFFVRRPVSVERLTDEGRNELISVPVTPRCKHDPEEMRELFFRSPVAEAAYAVALAWGEQTSRAILEGGDGAVAIASTYAWLLVAGELGHELAAEIVSNPEDSGYDEEVRITAEAEARLILENIGVTRAAARSRVTMDETSILLPKVHSMPQQSLPQPSLNKKMSGDFFQVASRLLPR